MPRFGLRYLGHRPGAALSYFTGASVTLTTGEVFEVPAAGFVLGRGPSAARFRPGSRLTLAAAFDFEVVALASD